MADSEPNLKVSQTVLGAVQIFSNVSTAVGVYTPESVPEQRGARTQLVRRVLQTYQPKLGKGVYSNSAIRRAAPDRAATAALPDSQAFAVPTVDLSEHEKAAIGALSCRLG